MTAPTVVDLDDHADFVNRIVHRTWLRYREFVDFDDLQQEAAVWWYGKGQKHLPAYLADATRGRLAVSIGRYVEGYARAQKAVKVGYEPRDQYRYSPREVHDLLPIALDPDGLPEPGHQEGPAAKGNLAEGGDLLAALVDVRRALAQLTEADLHFLTLADDCSYDWERVAARMAGGVPDSMRRRHARIAERMARWLSNEETE